MRNTEQPDFGCTYSANLPAVLAQLNIALAFTSYQAGRLMLVRSDGDTLDVNFKSFPRPMGLVATNRGLTLGIFTQVLHFAREDGLVEKIKQPLQRIEDDITAPRIKPKETDTPAAEAQIAADETEEQRKLREYEESLYAPVDARVDACFITRSTHHTGMINIHDIDWGDDGLWAVNSSFSCLCTLEPDYSFVPRWKPHFISALVPEDRCHLNGMALRDGRPAFVTTFSQLDQGGQWRKQSQFGGTLMDVQRNEVLLDDLTMPHSPRWHDGQLYFCNSGHGLVCRFNPRTGQAETLLEVPGFTRGLTFLGPIMIVGLSRVRQSDVTRPAPLTQKYAETYSGLWLFDLQNNREIGQLRFTGNVDQIYDVAVLSDCHFPELIEPSHPRMRNHFCHPELQA